LYVLCLKGSSEERTRQAITITFRQAGVLTGNTVKKRSKIVMRAATYRWAVASAGGAVLSRLGHIRDPLLVGQRLPDLGNLLDPLRPRGILRTQVHVVQVGVQDHGNCGLVT
jgi:hypothetical protein